MAPAAGMSFQPTQAPPRPFGSQQLYDAGPSSYYHTATAEGTQDRTTSFLIWVILRIHHHQDTFDANFEYWSRLFSTPNQQADPTFQTPVATGRPGRDVGPPERHTYSTDHVHAQRKRGRHGQGGRGG
ncbi:hypothetical protein PVAP13_4KG203900 [Panicum virgatum]|uniref:Uncharacterized protein n=1 Tax=Panicum virgatum TaxID=38727 RepID=A0A8T0TKW9_PANVG|nr:hypothetical protein PVAP13_4KG203900 [Panicum virgatum]